MAACEERRRFDLSVNFLRNLGVCQTGTTVKSPPSSGISHASLLVSSSLSPHEVHDRALPLDRSAPVYSGEWTGEFFPLARFFSRISSPKVTAYLRDLDGLYTYSHIIISSEGKQFVVFWTVRFPKLPPTSFTFDADHSPLPFPFVFSSPSLDLTLSLSSAQW